MLKMTIFPRKISIQPPRRRSSLLSYEIEVRTGSIAMKSKSKNQERKKSVSSCFSLCVQLYFRLTQDWVRRRNFNHQKNRGMKKFPSCETFMPHIISSSQIPAAAAMSPSRRQRHFFSCLFEVFERNHFAVDAVKKRGEWISKNMMCNKTHVNPLIRNCDYAIQQCLSCLFNFWLGVLIFWCCS